MATFYAQAVSDLLQESCNGAQDIVKFLKKVLKDKECNLDHSERQIVHKAVESLTAILSWNG